MVGIVVDVWHMSELPSDIPIVVELVWVCLRLFWLPFVLLALL